MQVLAIIPARGGSKGIPRKNLIDIGGIPLIAHSIRHAKQAQSVSRVLVSTDDEEIRTIALEHGAEAPFLRPPEIAQDQTLDLPVFEHALRFLDHAENYRPDLVVHLRPTAPLRRPEWIDQAVDLLVANPSADSVRSVSPPDKHPYRIFRIDTEGYLEPIMEHEHAHPYLLRRQDLPPMYYYNCVIDVTRPSTIFNKHSMTGEHMLPFIMEAESSFDIDTTRDLEIVRLYASRFA